VEVGRELHVPEERCRSFHGELTLGFASVDKEVDGEDGFAVRSEIANVLECELGVGGDGILNAGEAELACDGEIVEASTIAVAEVDKLKCYPNLSARCGFLMNRWERMNKRTLSNKV
jgi:hypothetical protein